ncbi:helix-turn-helix domain-containing protein [uncultured Hoeflea sp.]|uniref:helix-turn-helix domain-containing protein n=1 Tax=uncultured Hoeflea sp. TaxID=538666 RepID=UPI0030D9BC3D
MAPQRRKLSRINSRRIRSGNAHQTHPTLPEALTGTLLGNIPPVGRASSRQLPEDGRKSGDAGASSAVPVLVSSRRGSGSCNGFADTLRCRITWRLVAELFAAACERDLPEGAARRRPRCHMRQIAMYLSHVVLSLPYQSIATAFGRDRSTVMHACAVVEDRRDDAGYDRFVEQCERCIKAVFAPLENDDAEL